MGALYRIVDVAATRGGIVHTLEDATRTVANVRVAHGSDVHRGSGGADGAGGTLQADRRGRRGFSNSRSETSMRSTWEPVPDFLHTQAKRPSGERDRNSGWGMRMPRPSGK
jgi:hypothetical protein